MSAPFSAAEAAATTMTQATGVAIAKEAPDAAPPALSELFFAFFRLGITCFGGPAIVAYIKDMVVTRKRWLPEEDMNDGIVLGQSLPGVIAMDTAAYVGLRLRGLRGALMAYVGLTLPAFLLMLGLTASYVAARTLPRVISLMTGLQILVVAIVANAAYSFLKRVVHDLRSVALAATCGALLLGGISPFIVIAGSALAGCILFQNLTPPAATAMRPANSPAMLRRIALLALIPLTGLLTLLFIDKNLLRLALLMMKINVFAFGGGYTSVPLMLHEVVSVRGWITKQTLMDGIALGQITPGPVTITATFIGYVLFGLAGAFVSTMAVYTPCFLLTVSVAPYFDRLKTSATFARASKGIAGSFVGLLLFATVRFGSGVHWNSLSIVVGVCAFAALVRKVDILYVVLVGAAVSLVLF